MADQLFAVCLSADASVIAVGGAAESIHLFPNPLLPAAKIPFTEPILLSIPASPIDNNQAYAVTYIAFSPDRKYLVAAADNFLFLWTWPEAGATISDPDAWKRKTIKAHRGSITGLEWFKDSSGFVSASQDRQVLFFDHAGEIQEAWSPAPYRLSGISITYLSDDADGAERPVLVATGFAPQGSIAAEGQDTVWVILFYDLFTSQVTIRTPELPASPSRPQPGPSGPTNRRDIQGVSTSSTGLAAVSVGSEGIQLWDVRSATFVRLLSGHVHTNYAIRCTFWDRYLMSGSEDGRIYVWDTTTGTLKHILQAHDSGCCNAVAFSILPLADNMTSQRTDVPLMVSVGDDSAIVLWSTDDEREAGDE